MPVAGSMSRCISLWQPRWTVARKTTRTRSQMGGNDRQSVFTRRDALVTGLVSSLGPLALQTEAPAEAAPRKFTREELERYQGTWESVCAYNVLYFPRTYLNFCRDGVGNDFETYDRSDILAYVLKSIGRPSLLFIQEVSTEEDLKALEQVLEKVNPFYALAFQPDNLNTGGEQLDVITVYDKSIFEYLPMPASEENVDGGVSSRRDIILKKFRHKTTQKEFFTANVHFKASDDRHSRQLREHEANTLKGKLEEMSETPSFIIGGDFNIYDPFEKAYTIMAGTRARNSQPRVPGVAVDPVDPNNELFKKSFRNGDYAVYHTQATRRANCGGLDDRFDMMLVSEDFYKAGVGSYSATCNAGQSFNGDILDNKSGCDATGFLPEALYLASDHLPITMMVNFE